MKVQTFLHMHHLWKNYSMFILKADPYQMVNIETMSDKSRWIIDVCWEEKHALIGQDVEVYCDIMPKTENIQKYSIQYTCSVFVSKCTSL